MLSIYPMHHHQASCRQCILSECSIQLAQWLVSVGGSVQLEQWVVSVGGSVQLEQWVVSAGAASWGKSD